MTQKCEADGSLPTLITISLIV